MPIDRPSLKDVWAEQATDGFSMPIEDIRAQAGKFSRQIRHRNRREYIGSALVVLVFGLYTLVLPGLVVKLGSLLVLAGALYVTWQIHRRASTPPLPADAANATCVDYLRGELIRQRDALRSVGVWYLAPFVPGTAAMLAGLYSRAPAARGPVLIAAAICVATFVGIWLLNRWAASRLQKRIDALWPH